MSVVKILLAISLLLTSLISLAELPPNATPSAYGNGWQCQKGYAKSSNQCNKVVLPVNAELNYSGNGWQCQKGFAKSSNQCNKVVLPVNAQLNYVGSGWECNSGYRKSETLCLEMTQDEIQKQKEIQLLALRKYAELKANTISDGNCETENKTNAKVCVKVTHSGIECNKNYDRTAYKNCDVDISYRVDTDYSGGTYLDVDVECNVEIEYKGREFLRAKSNYERINESYNLYANDSKRETKTLNFSFKSFDEVTSSKISNVECKIKDVEIW